MDTTTRDEDSLSVLETRQLRKALIMAGGFGSRMGELTKEKPKPMLPLQGKPILEYTIDMCKRHGIFDIGISIFYFKNQIKDYFADGSSFGVRISYVEESHPLGTAGALWLCRDWLTEPFMMCNADELKDIDLGAMHKQHLKSSALATIALTRVKDPSHYGVVEMEGARIKRFVEKPQREHAPSTLINAGLYILNPEVAHRVPIGAYAMMEKDIFPALAAEGRLYGFPFKGQWFDTGTPHRYLEADGNWRGFRA